MTTETHTPGSEVRLVLDLPREGYVYCTAEFVAFENDGRDMRLANVVRLTGPRLETRYARTLVVVDAARTQPVFV